ncbi:hypothetical protein EYF80_000514 [Liparis tanakae]|uniref:Uncharacterized protein n=1 Tax=Liparis tanakae TaxID=230148 RepID=A0A4Z2JG49_9TELE|nr:hypothetical protein EYF80_000514 [Liparis tanakae]
MQKEGCAVRSVKLPRLPSVLGARRRDSQQPKWELLVKSMKRLLAHNISITRQRSLAQSRIQGLGIRAVRRAPINAGSKKNI